MQDDAKRWIQGMFGVLYTVSKEKVRNVTKGGSTPGAGTVPQTSTDPTHRSAAPQTRVSWLFLGFKLLMDFVQLFLLCVNPIYGYNIDRSLM